MSPLRDDVAGGRAAAGELTEPPMSTESEASGGTRLREPRRRVVAVAALFLTLCLLLVGPVAALQTAPETPGVRTFFGLSPRKTVWVVAQLHLLFAAFVVGVPWFAVGMEAIGYWKGDRKYDRLAHEFTKLLAMAFATTAALGGLFTFTLVGLYPRFSSFFFGVFGSSFYIYGGFFLVETAALYLYYQTWDRWRDRKRLHLGLGVFLIVSGTLIVFMGSAWSSYMMAPTGVDESGTFVGSTWEAITNPLWIPITVHRLLGNLTFGGFVVGAYAAVRFLGADSERARAHYDWMGYVGNFIGLMALLTLPFAGYYLGREVYSASPLMGNDMMGGDFSWAFIIQAMLLGLIFFCGNYYLWNGMSRIPGGERYERYVKYYTAVLVVCIAIWLTPRNIPLTPGEELAIGGQVHPILGFMGLMSTKNAVINLVILTTFLSFLLYRRANRTDLVPVSRQRRGGRVVLGAVGLLCIGLLGWYASKLLTLAPAELDLGPDAGVHLRSLGYLLLVTAAVVTVSVALTLRDHGHMAQSAMFGVAALFCTIVLGAYGVVLMREASPLLRHLAVAQWLILFSALVLIGAIDVLLYRGAGVIGRIRWGEINRRSQYALVALCVLIVMTMGMMAYVRSGLRQDWHVFGVLRDTSEWAYTPSIATMSTMVGGITVVFLTSLTFLFWLAGLGRDFHDED